MKEITTEQTTDMILAACRAIIESKPYLTEVDSKIGDGDHGIGMAGGMEKAAAVRDFDQYIRYDVDFHGRIMRVSPNEMLLRLWDQCNIREWTHFGTQYSEKTLDVLALRHERIYKALVARDEQAALEETRRHIAELVDELDERMAAEQN